jgi:hypothetical protein
MAQTLDEDASAQTVTDVLTHIFGHLSGDAVKEVCQSISDNSNHDLERATAAALRRALAAAHARIAPRTHILVDRFDSWFALWEARLHRGLASTEELAGLFRNDDETDPMTLATTDHTQWWPVCCAVLMRWASEQRLKENPGTIGDPPKMPGDLNQYLAANLLKLTHQAMIEVLREKRYQQGWIAWQQRFFEAIAQRTRTADANVADRIQDIASNTSEMNRYFRDRLAEVIRRLDLIEDAVVYTGQADLTVNINYPALPLLGQDVRFKDVKEAIDARLIRSVKASNSMLIAGMTRIVRLDAAYRVLRLGRRESDPSATLTVDDIILKTGRSSVLFALREGARLSRFSMPAH